MQWLMSQGCSKRSSRWPSRSLLSALRNWARRCSELVSTSDSFTANQSLPVYQMLIWILAQLLLWKSQTAIFSCSFSGAGFPAVSSHPEVSFFGHSQYFLCFSCGLIGKIIAHPGIKGLEEHLQRWENAGTKGFWMQWWGWAASHIP